MKKDILIITATHGDESIGVDVVYSLKKKTKLRNKFDWVIANPRALKNSVRFIDADLNRVFPGNKNGNYEERRAYKIRNIGKNYSQIIDLHGTDSRTGIFIIMTKINRKTLELAIKTKIEKIVIWPDSPESAGSLSTFMKCGVEIESGPQNSAHTKKQLKKILINFLENSDREIDIEQEASEKEFYIISGKVDKDQKNKKKKYFDWKRVRNWYPLFVGQYPGIACYKLKKVKSKNILAKLAE